MEKITNKAFNDLQKICTNSLNCIMDEIILIKDKDDFYPNSMAKIILEQNGILNMYIERIRNLLNDDLSGYEESLKKSLIQKQNV